MSLSAGTMSPARRQLCNARHRSRVHLRQVFRHALAHARCLWCSRVVGSSQPSSIHNVSASRKAVGPPSRWRRSIRTVRASEQLAVPGGGCVLSVVLGRRGASGDTHAILIGALDEWTPAYDTNAWAIDRTVIGGLPECPLVLQMAFVIRLEGGDPARSPLLA
jgi:hypothetical protein